MIDGNASKIAFGSIRQGDTVQNNWRFVENVLYRERAIATRYDKRAENFLEAIYLASIALGLIDDTH